MAEARFETYVSDERRYDELLDHAGSVRPHWRPLVDRLASDGAAAVILVKASLQGSDV